MKRIIQLIFCLFFISITEARVTYNFNSDWVIDYTLLPDSVKQRNYDGKKTVTLPHAWNENDAYRMPITQMTTCCRAACRGCAFLVVGLRLFVSGEDHCR